MEIIAAISICAIMPMAIVWIIFYTYQNADNKRAKVLIEAIKANKEIDASTLAKAFERTQRTPVQSLQLRLLRGCIFTLLSFSILTASSLGVMLFASDILPLAAFISLPIGISYLILYFVTRKSVKEHAGIRPDEA